MSNFCKWLHLQSFFSACQSCLRQDSLTKALTVPISVHVRCYKRNDGREVCDSCEAAQRGSSCAAAVWRSAHVGRRHQQIRTRKTRTFTALIRHEIQFTCSHYKPLSAFPRGKKRRSETFFDSQRICVAKIDELNSFANSLAIRSDINWVSILGKDSNICIFNVNGCHLFFSFRNPTHWSGNAPFCPT